MSFEKEFRETLGNYSKPFEDTRIVILSNTLGYYINIECETDVYSFEFLKAIYELFQNKEFNKQLNLIKDEEFILSKINEGNNFSVTIHDKMGNRKLPLISPYSDLTRYSNMTEFSKVVISSDWGKIILYFEGEVFLMKTSQVKLINKKSASYNYEFEITENFDNSKKQFEESLDYFKDRLKKIIEDTEKFFKKTKNDYIKNNGKNLNFDNPILPEQE